MRWFSFLIFAAVALRAEEERQWTCPPAAPFAAQLLAADGLRATLLVPGRGKAIVPFAQMSTADVQYIRDWRGKNPGAPLIDPERLAPWPAQAVAENLDVRLVSEDAAASRFRYESAHFTVEADVKLPVAVVREITAVFEATRAAVIAMPFGLHPGTEPRKYPVLMFSSVADYGRAGGNGGSGGTFNNWTRQMLLLLPNLGVKPGANGLTLDYQRNLFVLKHEVTHQVLGPWQPHLPLWLSEGFSECMAATPYTRGRYSFQGFDAALHDYVLKWRAGPDRRDLQVLPPARLMALDGERWNAEVAAQSAYTLYDSSALLVFYFLHYDDRGDGAHLAAYLDDRRRGVRPDEAESRHLLRGRTRESLTADIQALGRKLGLTLKLSQP